MPPRIRLVFAALNLALFIVAAVPLYGELSGAATFGGRHTPMLVRSPRARIAWRSTLAASPHGSAPGRTAADCGGRRIDHPGSERCRPPFQQLEPGPSRAPLAAACVRRRLWRHRLHVSAGPYRTTRLSR